MATKPLSIQDMINAQARRLNPTRFAASPSSPARMAVPLDAVSNRFSQSRAPGFFGNEIGQTTGNQPAAEPPPGNPLDQFVAGPQDDGAGDDNGASLGDPPGPSSQGFMSDITPQDVAKFALAVLGIPSPVAGRIVDTIAPPTPQATITDTIAQTSVSENPESAGFTDDTSPQGPAGSVSVGTPEDQAALEAMGMGGQVGLASEEEHAAAAAAVAAEMGGFGGGAAGASDDYGGGDFGADSDATGAQDDADMGGGMDDGGMGADDGMGGGDEGGASDDAGDAGDDGGSDDGGGDDGGGDDGGGDDGGGDDGGGDGEFDGGIVDPSQLRGPDVPGPDQGLVPMQAGEFVVRNGPAQEHEGLLRSINLGMDPKQVIGNTMDASGGMDMAGSDQFMQTLNQQYVEPFNAAMARGDQATALQIAQQAMEFLAADLGMGEDVFNALPTQGAPGVAGMRPTADGGAVPIGGEDMSMPGLQGTMPPDSRQSGIYGTFAGNSPRRW